MTVEQAVLNEIIGYLRKGVRRIPIHLIEQAHPEHQLSGRARLRGLRLKGLVSYAYREDDNTYEIFTPLSELEGAWEVLKTGGNVAMTTEVHRQAQDARHREEKKTVNHSLTQISTDNEEMSEEEREKILTEMRAFREGLERKCKEDVREELLHGAGRL